MTNHSTTSKNPFDIFIVGLRKGLDIGLYSLLPNVLMAFVLTYMLNLFGVMKFLGDTCGGVMGAFDLPGEAITVLLATWLSCGAGRSSTWAVFSAWPTARRSTGRCSCSTASSWPALA